MAGDSMALDKQQAAYNARMEEIRETEFRHCKDVTYLDHAGATLYAKSQLQAHLEELASSLYGNPHSGSPSSRSTSEAVDFARELVLRHFGTGPEEYAVVFASGCTGALKLVGEAFPWTSGRGGGGEGLGGPSFPSQQHSNKETPVYYTRDIKPPSSSSLSSSSSSSSEMHGEHVFDAAEEDGCSLFCYLEDNHTSVVGLREIAAACGARIVCAAADDVCVVATTAAATCTVEGGGGGGGGGGGKSKGGRGESEWATVVNDDNATDNLDKQLPPSAVNDRFVYHLFAYPAQSNFSGRRYPLEWTVRIPAGELALRCGEESLLYRFKDLGSKWLVLLDAASYVTTNRIDLSKHPAHFVAVSFYKMFGYPTGLGALLVRQDCTHLLRKKYFGGGSVLATISRKRFHVSRTQLHERLEDGTLPFLDIVSLKHGFAALRKLGGSPESISTHTFLLAKYVHDCMVELRHSNGSPVCVLYCTGGFGSPESQGPIVNFNLLRPNGELVGYSEVDKLACVHDIHLRTGCFCNTGACMALIGLSSNQVMHNLQAGHVCGDSIDLVDGHPTGSVRISFGYMSTFSDARKFLDFIISTFVDGSHRNTYKDKEPPPLAIGKDSSNDAVQCNSSTSDLSVHVCQHEPLSGDHEMTSIVSLCSQTCATTHTAAAMEGTGSGPSTASGSASGSAVQVANKVWTDLHKNGRDETKLSVEAIFLYPVKSCAPFQVGSWSVGEKGFLYDREWMVVSERGSCLSQKQEPKLSQIVPSIDLQSQRLILRARGQEECVVPLGQPNTTMMGCSWESFSVRICGDRVPWLDCGDEVAAWLRLVLGRDCRLAKQSPQHHRRTKMQPDGSSSALSLANEAQYLLIHRSSVEHLHQRMGVERDKISVEELIYRFRPNLVVVSSSDNSTRTCSSDEPLFAYQEEHWREVVVENIHFKVSGPCQRCQMVCVDQRSGARTPEPLKTLLAHRGSNAASFGIYLTQELCIIK